VPAKVPISIRDNISKKNLLFLTLKDFFKTKAAYKNIKVLIKMHAIVTPRIAGSK